MTVHVFIGPSGRGIDFTSYKTCVFHEPIRHGDLLRLDLAPGDVVGIVDGVFFDQPAIRHREILDALERQLIVVGGSSMGALRAADLAQFGMIGVGQVFSWIREGVITADHEVTIIHGSKERGFVPITVALVSVRFALAEVVRRMLLPESTCRTVIELFGRIYFADRTLAALAKICKTAGISDSVVSFVADVIVGPNDIKVQDARAVVAACMGRELRGGTLPNSAESSKIDTFALWVRTIAFDSAGTEVLRLSRVVQLVQLVSPDAPQMYSNCVMSALATEWRVPCNKAAVAQEFARRVGTRTTLSLVTYEKWLDAPNAAGGNGVDRIFELAVASYRVAPALPAWGALQEEIVNTFHIRTLETAFSALQFSFIKDDAVQTRTSQSRSVIEWVAELWSTNADIESITKAGYTRGYREISDIYRTALVVMNSKVTAQEIRLILNGARK